MVRLLILVLLCLAPAGAGAQTRSVDPDDLTLTVTLEPLDYLPYQGEMVLLTIHGIYKRHITLEKLEQPDLQGMNWMQLGQDHWYESTLDGKTVKNMRRRMALFPDSAGRIDVGGFQHHLTLLDENNNWFEHTIRSEPLSFTVQPAPQSDDWWFPVRRLQIADNWSNAPDQLGPDEGVLRIIRVSALGASMDMIPPMPELSSPSALIFPHPEKRLVDLTSRGPEAIAFWRWTIKPRNSTSAILEPITFSYFDTVQRKSQQVVISPKRVAYLPAQTRDTEIQRAPEQATLNTGMTWAVALAAFLAGVVLLVGRGRQISLDHLRRRWIGAKLSRELSRAAHNDDLAALRRTAHSLDRQCAPSARRRTLLAQLDARIYGTAPQVFDNIGFARKLRATLRMSDENGLVRSD